MFFWVQRSFSPSTQDGQTLYSLPLPNALHRLWSWLQILIFGCYSKMDRKETPKDNVPLLLGSLVRPIGRRVPGESQEGQTAAIRCHGSAFSLGWQSKVLVVWGPKSFPLWCSLHLLVGTHVYRVVNDRIAVIVFVSPFLPSPLQRCRVVGPVVLSDIM